MPALAFATEHNPGEYGQEAWAELSNGYAEAQESAKGSVTLKAWPGYEIVATLPYGGPVQGMLTVDGTLYVVAARQVYTINAAYDVTRIGTFGADGPVDMAANRRDPVEIGICAGGLFSVISEGVVTPVTTNIEGPISFDVVAGYGVVCNAGGQFGLSDIDLMTVWPALDIATGDLNRDGGVKVKSRRGEIWLMGSDSIEPWGNTGALDFPFSPIPGTGTTGIGLAAAATVREVPVSGTDTTLLYVATDDTVRRADAYAGAVVSTAEVSRLIAADANKSALTAATYQIPGHAFYVLSGTGWTRAYNVTTGRWSRLASYQLPRYRLEEISRFGDVWLAGDYETGQIYRLDPALTSEAGAPLVWTARAYASAYPQKIAVPSLYLDTIPGRGVNSTDPHDADPKVLIRTSETLGKTWRPVRELSTGRIGDYSRRVKTTRLGRFAEDGMLLEVSMSSATVRGITGGFAEIGALGA